MYRRFLSIINIWAILTIVLLGTSCKKPKPIAPEEVTIDTTTLLNLRVEIENTVGGAPIILKTSTDSGSLFYNSSNEDFRIKKLLYYVSNISFLNSNNEYVSSKGEQYFLVDESKDDFLGSMKLPPGEYTRIKFLLGVDSARNVSGIQNGALDPLLGMFWDWNTGYIMAMLEGESSLATNAGGLSYHIGGFTGPHSALRTVYIDFDRPIVLSETNNSKLVLTTDILKWFNHESVIKIEDLGFVATSGEQAVKIANNYQGMFISAVVQ